MELDKLLNKVRETVASHELEDGAYARYLCPLFDCVRFVPDFNLH